MKYGISLLIGAVLLLAIPESVQASPFQRGFRGGGGGGRSMGGGASINRGRASMPHMGGASRPSPAARPNVSRPNVSRPNVSRPAQRPAQRPNLPTTRPSLPTTRPSLPTTRPGGGLPTTRPATRPGSTLPGSTGGFKPSLPNQRPGAGNRPNLPGDLNRPSTRPGNVGNQRPGTNRPTIQPGTRPSFPDLGGSTGNGRPGGNRPGGIGNLPGGNNNRPSLPGNANRPGGGNRPSTGDLGDFLGIEGGLNRPTPRPGQRPGSGNRPGENRPGETRPGTNRPGANRPGENRPGNNRPGTNRPGNIPGGNRPDRPSTINRPSTRPGDRLPGQINRPPVGRPGANNRPINIGSINVGNSNFTNRPSWANINNNQINSVRNRWSNQINGLHNWPTTYPARIGYWNGWGNNVRHHWRWHNYHHRWFAGDWWSQHPGAVCRWHYYHRFNYHPWGYWWTYPAWTTVGTWFNWSANQSAWSEPVYYDYGTQGNVVYQDNSVYINGTEVATSTEFAESAAVLATVDPPANEQEAEEAEWLPLGTFALSTDEDDLEPSRMVQLAVDRNGIIAGTLYNITTDSTQAIQGQVDKETQRVAFRLGESDEVVAETGLYNLTQDSAPLLVHFGTQRTEKYNLVRLAAPEEEAEATDAAE